MNKKNENTCFELFWNAVPLSALILDRELRVINVNEAAKKILDYFADEIFELSVFELFPRDENIKTVIQKLKSEPHPINFFSSWKTAHGESIPVSVSISEFSDNQILMIVSDRVDSQEKDNKIKYLETVIDSLRMIQVLSAKEKDKKKMLDKICVNLVRTRGYRAIWIALFDDKGNATDFSEAGLGILPIEEDLRSGNLCSCITKAINLQGIVFTPNPLTECGNCPLASVFGHTACLTVKLEFAGRTYGFINAHLPVAKATETEQKIMIGIAKDISHILHGYEVEEARRQAEIEKGRAIKMRSDFISLASHQLKTPLTTVREAINILIEDLAGPLNEEQRSLMSAIKRNTDRVDRVVSDILILQKIEHGISLFNYTPYDLNKTLEELPISVTREALLKENEIDLIFSDEIAIVFIDKDKMKMALEILLKSIVNHTKNGTITIESKIEKDNFVVYFRSDNFDLKVADQKALFLESLLTYRQTRKSDETMLNMAICQEIVKQHKGQLFVTDVSDKNLEIILRLPLSKERQ